MFNRLKIFVTFIVLCSAIESYGQLSPGDLSQYHAHLEGLLNCTKCHILGEGISDKKCLECHTELKQRIDQNQGYHVSTEVKPKACIECHSDHHGRNFEMIRFDKNEFEHELTGYKLEGKHATIDCRECHSDQNIKNTAIRDKEYTFLGLNTECLACHQDRHQGTLDHDCAKCHDFNAFNPAKYFDHTKTDFPLRGKHQDVDCMECHPIIPKGGKDFQEFVGIDFGNCTSCHEDAHGGEFGQNCSECHTEESWHLFKGMGSFGHGKTHFPLTGKHRTTECLDCHKYGTDNKSPFKEFANWQTFDCVQCHKDAHETKLGSDCKACHSTRSFTALNKDNNFDHAKTDYALEGKHLDVDCQKCHTGASKIRPLEYERCNQCHPDFHEGQFTDAQGVTPDCAKCHTVINFAESNFTIEDHNLTSFLLEGAHMATPCFECHLKEDKWIFRNMGTKCNACHQDVHEGILNEKFYPDRACQNCHKSDGWQNIEFDHSATNFILEGKHLETRCNDCHLRHGIDNKHQLFSGLTARCMDCHQDIHHGQFMTDGVTVCSSCHAFDDWQASRFDHDQTDFKLEGAHQRVDCRECHTIISQEDMNYINYKIEDIRCAACH